MICKICNAEIEDNASVCPFCGAAVEGADIAAPAPEAPNFPDPAAPDMNNSEPIVSDPVMNTIPDPAASAPVEEPVPDLGLSEPAQPFADPAAQNPAYNSAAPQDTYNSAPQDTYNSAPQNNGYNVPPQNNGYGAPQPNYGQPTPPPMNNSGVQFAGSEYERQADKLQTMGIIALVVTLLCNICCAGGIVGIVGLVKYKGLKDNLYLISESGQKKANTGKVLSIISVVLTGLTLLGAILYFVFAVVLVASDAGNYMSSYGY